MYESRGKSGDMNDAAELSDSGIEYLLLRKTRSSSRIRGSGECFGMQNSKHNSVNRQAGLMLGRDCARTWSSPSR